MCGALPLPRFVNSELCAESSSFSLFSYYVVTTLWQSFKVGDYVHGYLESNAVKSGRISLKFYALEQCFSTAGQRPGTRSWHQLYRAARGSPGICNFSFLSIFHE